MIKTLFTGLIASLLSSTAFAADPNNPAANPANIMNTLNQTLPGAQAPSQGEFQTTSKPQYIQHAEEVTSTVVVKEIQLLGAQSIPDNVKAIEQKAIGQKMGFKDIQKLAADLEQAYRSDGFILVQVILPPQEIDHISGVVQLQVISGEIKQVIFLGDSPKAAKTQLQRYAEQIEVEDPISYHSIDRFLVLANQLPGIDVSATLVPDKNTTGASDLLVYVDQTPVSVFTNVNNRGTQYIGPNQGSVGASVYDIFGADALTFTGSTSLNAFKQLQYGSIDYDLIVGANATEINPSITSTTTQPGDTLSDLAMNGTSMKYNLGINQPLYTSTQQNLNLQTAFYHVDSNNNAFDGTTQLYEDHVTALSGGLNYQGTFWQAYHDITLSSTVGMPIIDTPSSLSEPSVANAQTTFVHFNLVTSDIRYLTQKISVALGTQLQYTPNTLVSSEQIGYGGQQFGQAFTPYVISGDSGYMGSLALRYDLPLFWGLEQLQPQIFYDAGSVYYTNAPGTSNNHASAQSAGIGLNAQWLKNLNVGLTLAKPLRITQTPGTSMGWAGFFNVTMTI